MDNKIIGIDVYSALHSPRGMGIYTINILKEIAKLDKENTYILYADTEDEHNVLPVQSNFIFKKLKAKNFMEYEQKQQERNLSYVSLTRAKENLYLVRAQGEEYN